MPATDRCNTKKDLGHAIIMHTYHVLQQMILLHKDPQGKNILDGTAWNVWNVYNEQVSIQAWYITLEQKWDFLQKKNEGNEDIATAKFTV